MARKREDAFKRGRAANALGELHAALILTAQVESLTFAKAKRVGAKRKRAMFPNVWQLYKQWMGTAL